MSATPAIVPADPQVWRKAFLDLRPSVSPCPGLTGAAWTATHARSVDFLDRWADEAVALGWTTLDLWGVHPQVGTVRVDFCGAMVLSGALVTAVTAEHIKWENATFCREQIGRPVGSVPLWQFGKQVLFRATCGLYGESRRSARVIKMLAPKIVRTFQDDGTCFDIKIISEMAGPVQSLLGRRMILNDEPHKVIGIVAEHFNIVTEVGDTISIRARPEEA